MITIVYEVAQSLLSLYKWVVILAAVVPTLVSFGVLDSRNRLVWTIGDFLYRLIEPALRPICRAMPHFGGLDLSYLVLLLLIWVVQMLLARIYGAVAYGNLQGLLM